MNIPTVGAAGANIVKYAIGYDFEYTNGMPIRYVGFPFPVAGQPKAVHHRYVFESNDVVSGKPMMQAIVDGSDQPSNRKRKVFGKTAECKGRTEIAAAGHRRQPAAVFQG